MASEGCIGCRAAQELTGVHRVQRIPYVPNDTSARWQADLQPASPLKEVPDKGSQAGISQCFDLGHRIGSPPLGVQALDQFPSSLGAGEGQAPVNDDGLHKKGAPMSRCTSGSCCHLRG